MRELPYMVTGSIAANFHATPRMTRDIDIVVERHETNAEKVGTLFHQDCSIDREMVQHATRDKGMFNMINNAFVIKVDFVVRKETE